MKEFDNWNKLRGVDFRIRFSPPKQFEAYIEQEREDTWEEALKWALLTGSLAIIVQELKEELYKTDGTSKERPRSGLRFSS